MTDWYVRPSQPSGYGNGSGTSYANAWSSLGNSSVCTFDYANDNYFHMAASDQAFQFSCGTNLPIWFTVSGGGSLPTELTAGTIYYTRRVSYYAMAIRATANGSDITLTGNGTGTITVHMGVNWDSIGSGDTLYLCGDFGHEERSQPEGEGGHNELPIFYLTHLVIPAGKTNITISGDPSHPASITHGYALFTGTGTWTAVSNGVYTTRYGTNKYVLCNHKLMNETRWMTTTDGVWPDYTDPASWVAGDCNTGASIHYLYVKPRSDCNANPDNDVYVTMCGFSHGVDNAAIVIPATCSDITVKDIVLYGSYIWIENAQDCTVDNVDTYYSYDGLAATGDCSGLTVTNSYYLKCADGVYTWWDTGGSTSDLTVSGCTVEDCIQGLFTGGLKDHHGVGCQAGTNLIIHDNIFINCATGVTLYNDNTYDRDMSGSVYNNICVGMYNNRWGDSSYMGVGIDQHGGPHPTTANNNIKFYNNICIDCSKAGFRMVPEYFSGDTYELYNNVAYDCQFGYQVASTVNGVILKMKNNISLLPDTPTYSTPHHMYWVASMITVPNTLEIVNNCYYPDGSTLFNYLGTASNFTTYSQSIVYDYAPHVMTTNSAPSPYVASGDAGTDDGNAFTAFDGSTGNIWGASGAVPHWLKIDLGTGRTATSYGIRGATVFFPTEWTLAGSNNDSSWTDLDTQTGITSWTNLERKDYEIASPSSYRYYRLTVTNTTAPAAGARISELYLPYSAGSIEADSIIQDPSFLNGLGLYEVATDFKIDSTSPCFGTGVWTGSNLKDYESKNQYNQTGGVSIGAYRGWKSLAIQLPTNVEA